MSIASKIFYPIRSMLDRIACVVFAVVFAQGPVYISQYLDVLSGARMEAQKNLIEVQEQAEDNGVTVEEFVARLLGNSDPIVRSSGEINEKLLLSYERYNTAYDAISNATVFAKPFRVAQYFDTSVAEALEFNPSVPLSIEGAVYAFVGLVVGWLLFSIVAGLIGAIFSSGKKKEGPKLEKEKS